MQAPSACFAGLDRHLSSVIIGAIGVGSRRSPRILSVGNTMRKRIFGNILQSQYTRSGHRQAFTLSELVVAIGILVLMLALAGQVFNLTVKSTGQATALTEVSQLLRAFEDTLREDLRHVQPGHSLLLVQGNPVSAYWTREGAEAARQAATRVTTSVRIHGRRRPRLLMLSPPSMR